MPKAKKIINRQEDIVQQTISGYVRYQQDRIHQIPGTQVLVRNRLDQGKVGIIMGYGAGHEPDAIGYLGSNYMDAQTIGGLFAAPGPFPIYEALKAADTGAGSLILISNCAGDVLNAKMALEMAEEDGVTYITTERNWSKINHTDYNGHVTSLTADEGSVDCMDKKGETLVYVAMRQNKLQELYCLTEQGEMQLSHINERIFEKKSVVTPKPLRITNDEGVEIDGWVLEPVDYDESKSYPAILDIHGGPKTVYGTCFMHEMQYWANEGYFVFFCNPRGGDGRGNEFADIRGRYGQEDYEDIMAFTDYVLWSYPQIDKSRIGVTGGSYGGFMTNWIIGHTHRFAAAASQRSISNWISMEGTSDIGPYFGLDQAGGNAWERQDQAWWHSPLKYADKCTTPTLFIHSDEDYRCWMVEALQMFSALKVHGIESRVCLFHGENHELSRSGKPEHRIRRLKEITDWFNHYLKK